MRSTPHLPSLRILLDSSVALLPLALGVTLAPAATASNIDSVGTLSQQNCPQAFDGDNENHDGELVTNVANQNLLSARLSAPRPDIVVMSHRIPSTRSLPRSEPPS